MSARDAKGFLLVTMDCPPAFEDEFNAWYDTEHVPERCAVPGFETGLRFVCLDGHPRYLAIYDLTRPDVLDSEAYRRVSLERSSPWTKRVTSRVRVWRSAGLQIYPGGALTRRSARLLLLRFRARPRASEPKLITGLRATFDSRPETLQTRLLAFETGGAMDYLGVVELSMPLAAPLDLSAFGDEAAALDLVNTYAPY